MQKLFMVLLLILSSTQLVAQKKFAVDKGSFIIGGSAGFSSTETFGRNRLTNITLRPSVSFFVVPNLAIGGTAFYNRVSGSGSSFTFYGVGPAVAYYFGNAKSRSYPFVSGSMLYRKQTRFPHQIDLRLSSGIAFMIAKNVAITNEAFFMLSTEAGNTTNSYGIEIGIATFIF